MCNDVTFNSLLSDFLTFRFAFSLFLLGVQGNFSMP